MQKGMAEWIAGEALSDPRNKNVRLVPCAQRSRGWNVQMTRRIGFSQRIITVHSTVEWLSVEEMFRGLVEEVRS